MTALLLGFFSAGWFGWGHAAPTGGLAIWLDIGGAVGPLVAVAGTFVAFRSPAAPAGGRPPVPAPPPRPHPGDAVRPCRGGARGPRRVPPPPPPPGLGRPRCGR